MSFISNSFDLSSGTNTKAVTERINRSFTTERVNSSYATDRVIGGSIIKPEVRTNISFGNSNKTMGGNSSSMATSPISLFKAFAITFCMFLGTTPVQANSLNQSSKIISYQVNDESIEGADDSTNKEKPVVLSQKLKKEFGFNTAQWASILQVERKTLYNWEKNIDTRIQQKVLNRLTALDEFYSEIDSEHAKYIAKATFGKKSFPTFTTVITSDPLIANDLVSVYEEMYAEFDAIYKRDKHQRAMS